MTRLNSRGMSGHQSARAGSHVWLTPPEIIRALGLFDLDPCAAPDPRPWPTAVEHYTERGLEREWRGRVWLNPPYGQEVYRWLARLADHGDGIALIFARTETQGFFETVWQRADALLFLRGRLHFHYPTGERASFNAGAPSVLIAYGRECADRLAHTDLGGKYIRFT